MPEAGYKKSKYDLEDARFLKVPRGTWSVLYKLYGMNWAEKSRDVLYEHAGNEIQKAAVQEG